MAIKVVLYLNQFFAGIGGEDKADVGFGVEETPKGPAMAYQMALDKEFGKGEAQLVATIYCGDNYFSKNTEASCAEAMELIKPYQPDLFFAGPGFAAGRYCEACGAMCKAVKETFNIPVISAMRDDCKSEYNKVAYIVKTNENSGTMRARVAEMVKLGKYLLADHSEEYTPLINLEHIPDPDEYNYFRREILACSFTDKTVAERSVEKLLAKVKGEEFETEVVPERLEIVPCPPAIKDMAKATICLVSDGGLVPKGNPDRMATRSNLIWNSYDLDALFKDYEVVHAGYFNDYVLQDPNRLLPVDALNAEIAEGKLGAIDTLTYAMPACTTVSKKCEENGAIIAQDILEKHHADAVILTSTWGTSTRCGSTIARQIEKAGIPTVQITAVPNIAEMVGVNRILTGVAVPNPVGNPKLSADQEKVLRKQFVDKALEMLQTDYEKCTVVTLD